MLSPTWTGRHYFETMPADKIDLALRLEADRMIDSIFDPEEIGIRADGDHQRAGGQ